MNTPRHTILAALPLLAGAMLSSAAQAHHGMDGQLPNSLISGLISGLAHPVIGLDHLAFLLAAALAVAGTEPAAHARLPWFFVLPSLAAVGWHAAGFDLPGAEILVALSLIVLALLLIRRRASQTRLLLPLLVAAGLLHGYAYGESIVGAEPTPLLAYLAGLALVQYSLCLAAILLYRRFVRYWLSGQENPGDAGRRMAGWAVGGIGGIFLVLAVIG